MTRFIRRTGPFRKIGKGDTTFQIFSNGHIVAGRFTLATGIPRTAYFYRTIGHPKRPTESSQAAYRDLLAQLAQLDQTPQPA